ncbi:phosphatidate cytidylyltransferase [Roseovarius salinarum]|uniref:phosphatidate cytidylyltransferase n=1 Tax=Roseovarius salinarum TaxID=1981892 RepID=UPI000C32AF1B|nr:phosphatidate cytidylyltransferase [Roseovarius salinarum]
MTAAGKWDDLAVRLASAGVLVAAGLAGVLLGGIWFRLLIAAACGLMCWELLRLLGRGRTRSAVAIGLGAALGGALLALPVLPGWAVAAVVAGAGVAGAAAVPQDRGIALVYLPVVALAGLGLLALRGEAGVVWVIWLICVVVASDVMGYFAGRLLGGPRFWPRVSPKKTWSGTVAGWLGAAAVGWAFMAPTGAGAWLVVFSAALALAAQMGDIAESAVKRRVGVKDASALIPGHGGLLDRFDAMLAAAALVALVRWASGVPGGAA